MAEWLTPPMVAMMRTNGEAVYDEVAPLVASAETER